MASRLLVDWAVAALYMDWARRAAEAAEAGDWGDCEKSWLMLFW